MSGLKAVIAGWVEVLQTAHPDFVAIMMDFWAEGVRHHKESSVFDLNKMYIEFRAMVQSILERVLGELEVKSGSAVPAEKAEE